LSVNKKALASGGLQGNGIHFADPVSPCHTF